MTYDYTEEIDDKSITSQSYGAYITRYAAEFLRFRFGYEHTDSDILTLDGLNTIYVEMAFVFGAHPIEPYWVNR